MTGTPPQPLPYRGLPKDRSSVLQVEWADGRLVITWPVPAPWTVWVAIGSQLSAATAKAILLVSLVVLWGRFTTMMKPSAADLHRLTWLVLPSAAVIVATIVVWTLLAFHTFRRHRRWGYVPRQLTVTPDQIRLEWLGVSRMRQRAWRSSPVTAIRWRRVSDVFHRRVFTVRVTVRFDKGRPLRLVLTSRDPATIERARTGLMHLLRPATISE